MKQADLVKTLIASKRKRTAITASTSTSTMKPATKKPTSRNQPSSATPVTTRVRAKTIKPSHLDTGLDDNNDQMIMS